MGNSVPLLVTARLSSPLAGDPPQLDSLLEWLLSPFEDQFRSRQDQGIPHHRVDRALPAPEQGVIRIPLAREWLGKHLVAHCSNPILPLPRADAVDHVCKRIGVENAGLVREDDRRIVTTTNAWTKSYRLPLRIRLVDRVCWFALGNRRNLRKTLRDAGSIGKKVSIGYGRVKEWMVESIAEDFSWQAQGVLMRTLPLEYASDLKGWTKSFGACCPPYWHQERFTEVAVPS